VLPLGGIRRDEVPMIDISEDIKLPPFYARARWSGPDDLRDAEKVAHCLAHRFDWLHESGT
jgi:hypothetical protein